MAEKPDRIGTIETRGIDAVPDHERHGRASELFWMWFGANMGVLGITLGAGLVVFNGLNAFQVLLVAVLGAGGSFAFVGALSVAGQRGGAPGLTLSRAVFGPRGNAGPTLVSWLGFVGWETIMCTTAAFALLALLDLAGIGSSVALTVVCVVVTVIIAAVIGLFGHATIMFLQRWLTYVFGALTAVVVVFLIANVDFAAVTAVPAAPASQVVIGIGTIAAGTGLGWLAAGADYARYLPRTVSPRSIISATIWGAGLPLVVLITMGALMSTGGTDLAQANDPVAAIGSSLPSWMAVPYLLTAVAGLIAAADLSMYSSGLNLLAVGIRIPRTAAILVDALIITVGGIYITVIAEDFYGPFITFLTLLAVPLVVWGVIFLIDMAFRRSYDPVGLADTSTTSRYWYTGGIRWVALGPWIAGIAVGFAFTTAAAGEVTWFAGPLATTFIGRNGLGWLMAAITAGVCYLVARRIWPEAPEVLDPVGAAAEAAAQEGIG
ncbi:MAG: purine-cytosine permease family protein [Propioniciclava sp.]